MSCGSCQIRGGARGRTHRRSARRTTHSAYRSARRRSSRRPSPEISPQLKMAIRDMKIYYKMQHGPINAYNALDHARDIVERKMIIDHTSLEQLYRIHSSHPTRATEMLIIAIKIEMESIQAYENAEHEHNSKDPNWAL